MYSLSNFKNKYWQVCGENITIVDPAEATAIKLKEYLDCHNMLTENTCEGKRDFYVSDDYANFDSVCKSVLKYTCKAEKVDIERY